MRLDPRIEPVISVAADRLLPEAYRQRGPLLVALVRAYLEWSEESGPEHHARRLLDYGDVDLTPDSLLIHLRAKYLSGVSVPEDVNLRALVKHCLDLYRSRGSERAVSLFFRLAYRTGAQVYRPGEHLMRASAATWVMPRYVELALSENNRALAGEQVTGITSAATAFVDRVVRKKSPLGRLIDVAYVSASQGRFVTGELFSCAALSARDWPRVVGSLTGLSVSDGASGLSVGDVVDLTGSSGYRGRARVSAVSSTTGAATMTVEDGGWGYTSQTTVTVSTRVLTGQVTPVASLTDSYWRLGETVTQPLANLNYVSLVGSGWTRSSAIYSYYANGTQSGSGVVLAVNQSNSTAGQLFVYVASGNLNSSAVYGAANATSANLDVSNGYVSRTATGLALSQPSTVTIALSSVSPSALAVGETVTQSNSSGVYASGTYSTPSNSSAIALTQVWGRFDLASNVVGSTSMVSAAPSLVVAKLGVSNVTNSFVAEPLAPVTCQSGASVTLTRVSAGSGAAASVAHDFLYSETVGLNDDFLRDYASVALNASTYGFPQAPSANLSTVMVVALHYQDYTVGAIRRLTGTALGSGYDESPLVRARDPLVAPLGLRDWIAQYSNSSGSFADGEVVDQNGNQVALVKSSNATHLLLRRATVNHPLQLSGSNASLTVSGQTTGANAWVTAIELDSWPTTPHDLSQPVVGLDAVVRATVAGAAGSATSLEVVDSGFGYVDGETVTFQASASAPVGSATASLGLDGSGSGYHVDSVGAPSGDSARVIDSDYWQDYSYDVRAPVPPDSYASVLAKLLHVAGTKSHSTFRRGSVLSVGLSAVASVSTNSAPAAITLDFTYEQASQYLPLVL